LGEPLQLSGKVREKLKKYPGFIPQPGKLFNYLKYRRRPAGKGKAQYITPPCSYLLNTYCFRLSKLFVNLKLNQQGKVKGEYALPSPLSGFPALADSLAYLER
jgi:hypothetical protein